MTQRGKFITIEGVEGAGKTTNIPFIQRLLASKVSDVIHTREPGGTEPGEAIREVLISTNLPAMHHDTELLLMFAARAEHVRRKIEPALASGKWVLCDRFTDASYAYQGGGRGISLERIAELENWVQGELRPDYTLLFDVDANTGLGRARSRGETDRFEAEDIEFFNRVRQQYLTMAEKNPQRYSIINAGLGLTEVEQQLEQVISEIL
ncbi:MAG: dTMP kinase [Thiotrichaceae bacterium]